MGLLALSFGAIFFPLTYQAFVIYLRTRFKDEWSPADVYTISMR